MDEFTNVSLQYRSGHLGIAFQSKKTEVTPEVARYLLLIRFPAADKNRVNELSAKARAGVLTEAETQELDSYLHFGSPLAIM